MRFQKIRCRFQRLIHAFVGSEAASSQAIRRSSQRLIHAFVGSEVASSQAIRL